MALTRESTCLPTIKCSSCGNQVEISMMGEHACNTSTSELSSALEAQETIEENQLDESPYSKHDHTLPPIDIGNPYLYSGQMTPNSLANQSPFDSPGFPNNGSQIGAIDEDGTRFEDHLENLWEAPNSATFPKRPGGYGGFDDRLPEQPNKQDTDESIIDRMLDAIPGPFNLNKRSSTARNGDLQRKDSLEYSIPSPEELSPQSVPKKDGIMGFEAHDSTGSAKQANLAPSETYARLGLPAEVSHTHLTSPPPGSRSDQSKSTGRYRPGQKKSMRTLTHNRKPPPRTGLLSEDRYKNKGSVDLAVEFGVKNPYHSSTSSVSSGYSDDSLASQTTANTSPTRSHAHQVDFDQRLDEIKSTGERTNPRNLRIDAAAAAAANPRGLLLEMVESPYGGSPRDIRFGRLSPDSQQPLHSRRAYSSSPQQEDDHKRGVRRLNSQMTQEHGRPTQTRQRDAWGRQGSVGQGSLPSRGNCRSCGTAIRGKSISSADGRLTGKYHKACFVCTTCLKPFSSSVFYVLKDKPYCEQHYHKLNNSLCGSCGRGIEGQFAEDEAKIKHHIGCFRCVDCGLPLTNGYFEVGSYAYCEQDAWKRVQSQPPQVGQEARQSVPSRVAFGARIPRGLPARPNPHSGKGDMQRLPPPTTPNDGRLGVVGSHLRLQMNKRTTRLGRMDL